jgi:hypothetical protein
MNTTDALPFRHERFVAEFLEDWQRHEEQDAGLRRLLDHNKPENGGWRRTGGATRSSARAGEACSTITNKNMSGGRGLGR